MKYFVYKLTEITYRNRVEWEDGHGSLQNIVSDETRRTVISTWENMNDSFGEKLLKEGDPTLVLLPTSDGGHIEYSYVLERRELKGTEWEFVGYLASNRRNEWDTGHYPEDYFDDPPICESDYEHEEDPEQPSYCLNCRVREADCLCGVCEAEIEEMEKPRCICGKVVASEEIVLCDECLAEQKKWERECLKKVLRFRIFSSEWWCLLHDVVCYWYYALKYRICK